MSYHFDPLKAAQATAVLLRKAPGRRHNYTAAIKMLYTADRESIRKTGSPITGDKPYAMDNGPVLTHILNLIKDDSLHDEEQRAIWSKYFRTTGYDIELISDPGDSELSNFDIEILENIFKEHGAKNYAQLINEAHNYPEWLESHTQGTSSEIHLKTLLKALGMEDEYDQLSTKQIEDAHFAKLFEG